MILAQYPRPKLQNLETPFPSGNGVSKLKGEEAIYQDECRSRDELLCLRVGPLSAADRAGSERSQQKNQTFF